MFGIPSIKDIGLLAGGIGTVLAGTIAWWCWDGWNGAIEDLKDLQSKVNNIVVAVQVASDNKTINVDTAAGQIVLLGDSNRTMKVQIEEQNRRLDEMVEEAILLKKKNAELKMLADKARAQKEAALRELGDLAIAPAKKRDCETLVKEADRALNLLREAGL